MAIASVLVAAIIILLTVGAAYATFFRGAGNACSSCGSNCGCGSKNANPINVSFDTKE